MEERLAATERNRVGWVGVGGYAESGWDRLVDARRKLQVVNFC